MYNIKIAFEEKGNETISLRQVKPGESLLEICLNNDIVLGHECGGICSCTTCFISIERGEEFLEELTIRESDVLKMKGNLSKNSRLGCQCLLLDGSGEIEITIPVQPKVFERSQIEPERKIGAKNHKAE